MKSNELNIKKLKKKKKNLQDQYNSSLIMSILDSGAVKFSWLIQIALIHF